MERVSVLCRTLGVLAILAIGTPASADEWPMFRHDARRSAASPGSSDLARPAVAFRTYLGGTVGNGQFVDLDVDSDGRAEIVYLSGGRLIAKEPTSDIILWETRQLSVTALSGVVDLDGDGVPELVAYRSLPSVVVVVSSTTGEVLWTMPSGQMNWIGEPRWGDLNGDGMPELYVGSGQCGTPDPTIIDPPGGIAFTFCDAACDIPAGRELWRFGRSADGSCGHTSDVLDFDGDGDAELGLSWRYAEVTVLDGGGTIQDALSTVGNLSERSATRPIFVNADADPALEIITVTNAYNTTVGSRRLAMFDHTPAGFVRRWEFAGAAPATDRMIVHDAGSVADLDGDGSFEVVYSFYDSGTSAWTLGVRGVVDGAVLAERPDLELVGVVDLDDDGRGEILATSGTDVRALSFEAGGTLRERWTLPDLRVVMRVDPRRRPLTRSYRRVLVAQLDDDPASELVLGVPDASGSIVGLRAYDAAGDTPALIASFDAPAGITLLSMAPADPITRDYPQLVVVRSDGFLLVLDRDLVVTNRQAGLEFSIPGMRVGGYYTGGSYARPSPVIARVGGVASIFVRDSRGAVVRLDATGADISNPPVQVYERHRSTWPSVVDLDGDGTRDLLLVEGDDLVALDAATATTELWRRADISDERLLADPIPIATPSGPAVFFAHSEPTHRFRGYLLAGRDGAEIWQTANYTIGWGNGNYGLHSAADLAGDGWAEIISPILRLSRIDGASGTVTSMGSGDYIIRAGTTLTDMDGDGTAEVFAHGGWFADRVLSPTAMTERAIGGGRPNLGRYGAVVSCGGRGAIVSGTQSGGGIYRMEYDGTATIREAAAMVLASGAAYAPGAVPPDALQGDLGHVNSIAALTGAADPAVLVGSTDGFLYALDACTLALRWALDLHAPVGEPVIGDVDDDGVDEVVVSVGDGYLVGVHGAAYDSPAPALDQDPDMPGTPDVDEVDSADRLAVRWSPVAGATSYEVGVLTAAGTGLVSPPFTDVGDVSSTVIGALPLTLGGRYQIAVRALGPGGSSGEALTDGVVIVDSAPPVVTVTAAPTVFWPDVAPGTTQLEALFRDNWGIVEYGFEIRSADGTPLREIETGTLMPADTSASVRFTWDGTDAAGVALPAGPYLALGWAVDLEGRRAEGSAIVTLDPDVAMMMPDGGGMADAGPGDPPPPPSEGCGCRVGAASNGAPAVFMLCLALAFLRRRRRFGG